MEELQEAGLTKTNGKDDKSVKAHCDISYDEKNSGLTAMRRYADEADGEAGV